jgi:hypothetical protein
MLVNINFELRKKVLRVTPMSTLAHTAANIADFTEKSCADAGLGNYGKDEEGNEVLSPRYPLHLSRSRQEPRQRSSSW